MTAIVLAIKRLHNWRETALILRASGKQGERERVTKIAAARRQLCMAVSGQHGALSVRARYDNLYR